MITELEIFSVFPNTNYGHIWFLEFLLINSESSSKLFFKISLSEPSYFAYISTSLATLHSFLLSNVSAHETVFLHSFTGIW